MAASTWFHGSQWPPSNHGIIPSWRCTAAMARAVARTSDADRCRAPRGATGEERISSVVMRPPRASAWSARDRRVAADGPADLPRRRTARPCSTRAWSGRRTRLLPMTGLSTRSAVRVTSGALTMSHTRTRWYGPDRRVGVVGRADEAPQPPVRRVEPVGVVMAGRLEPRVAQPALQRGTSVDADVAPGCVVVLVGQRPVDRLGPATRHRHRHGAARTQHRGPARAWRRSRPGCARAPRRR